MFECWCYHLCWSLTVCSLCQLSVIRHYAYGMFLSITYLDVVMFVFVCFLSPFIIRIALHLIFWEGFMLFQYSIHWIICMSSDLIPEILFSCDGCYSNMFVAPSYCAACHCDSDCVWSIVMVVIVYANIVPWVNSPPSSHWTATVDSIKNKL